MEKQGNSEINKKSILSNKTILAHFDFFEKCSNDYKTKATHLMNKLALHLGININPSRPLESLQFLKNCDATPKNTIMGDWKFHVHGFHCSFEHIITKQSVSVSLVNGLQYGTLDPIFFTEFIKTSPEYMPLPIDFNNNYEDGEKILNILLKNQIN